MKKNILLMAALATLALAACGSNGGSGNNGGNSSAPDPEPEYAPQVFLMAGQSNMEGNSYFDNGHNWLRNYFETAGIEDGDRIFEGMPEVQTSYYGTGYGELDDDKQIHASNTEVKINGKFLPTQVGMGHTEKMFGPELGAAYVISQHVNEDQPVYFIKCASGGSGFAQSGTTYNWDVTKDKNLYHERFKPFVENNLKLIEEETGLRPVVKGFMWHQGESDTATEKIAAYHERFGTLMSTIREDFASFAKDEDGANIALIDCTLTEQSGASSGNKGINGVKKEIEQDSDMNFLIDGNAPENNFVIATSGFGDVDGANGSLHYKAESAFRMGMAYGQTILDNNLIDFLAD